MNIELYEKAHSIVHNIQLYNNTIKDLEKSTSITFKNEEEEKVVLLLSTYSVYLKDIYDTLTKQCILEHKKMIEILQKELRDLN